MMTLRLQFRLLSWQSSPQRTSVDLTQRRDLLRCYTWTESSACRRSLRTVSSYLRGNKLCLPYKHSSRNAVYANNRCYSENRTKHINTICTRITHILAVKTGGIHNECALKNYGNEMNFVVELGHFWTFFTAIFQLH